MANEEHLAILKQGVEAWNRWREEDGQTPDLKGADLSDMDLRSVNLEAQRPEAVAACPVVVGHLRRRKW